MGTATTLRIRIDLASDHKKMNIIHQMMEINQRNT